MSDPHIGWAASAYLLGAVSGAFLFGWLTDRLGHRRPFFVTLGLYLAASAAMVLSPSFEWYLPPLRPARLVSPSGRPSRWRRALAIAVFYAPGTALGGIAGPSPFGVLIGSGERAPIAGGYVLGATLMLLAAAVAWRYGVAPERRPLEDVAAPSSSAQAQDE
jgi:MFS family permease